MALHVARLPRPYDFRVLIEAYVYTKRRDFGHFDYGVYYADLLSRLELLFGIRLVHDGLTHSQRVLWMLFEDTVRSLLQITTPWDGYLEAGLLHRKLEASGEPGRVVYQASTAIADAAKASEAAHREMLYSLFVAIFGESERVVTSEELRQAGFDDSQEPDIGDYDEYF